MQESDFRCPRRGAERPGRDASATGNKYDAGNRCAVVQASCQVAREHLQPVAWQHVPDWSRGNYSIVVWRENRGEF